MAHTGLRSALLTVPGGFGGSTLFQNAVDHGGLPALGAADVGFAPMLSFWAKGDGSTTGNVLFALHYLDSVGNILNGNGGNHFFQGAIKPTIWSQISFQANAYLAGTKAVLLEMNTAVGPLMDGRPNAVYIDDVVLTSVPEASTYAMLLAGMAGLGFVARRRRV